MFVAEVKTNKPVSKHSCVLFPPLFRIAAVPHISFGTIPVAFRCFGSCVAGLAAAPTYTASRTAQCRTCAHTRRLKKHSIPCAELHETHERSAASHVEFSCQNSPTHYVGNVAAQSAIIDISTMRNFEVMGEHFKLYSMCTAATTSLSFMHSACQAAWVGVLLLHSGYQTAWLGVLSHSGCQTAWLDVLLLSGCQTAWLGVLLLSGCQAAWLGVLLHSGCQTAWLGVLLHSGCQAARLGVFLHSRCQAARLGVLLLHSGYQAAWMCCCYIPKHHRSASINSI